MLDQRSIEEAVRRVAGATRSPCRVIAFGSYARGDAGQDSDLDLLVVERDVSDYTGEYLRLREAIGSLGVGVDLLLYSKPEFAKRREWWTTPVYWAAREGKVMHDFAG